MAKRKKKFRGVIRGLHSENAESGFAAVVVEVEPGEWADESEYIIKMEGVSCGGLIVVDAMLCLGDIPYCRRIVEEHTDHRVTVVSEDGGMPRMEF